MWQSGCRLSLWLCRAWNTGGKSPMAGELGESSSLLLAFPGLCTGQSCFPLWAPIWTVSCLASTIDQSCVRQSSPHPQCVLVPLPPRAQTGMVSVHVVPKSGSTESWVSITSSSVSVEEVHFYWMYSTLSSLWLVAFECVCVFVYICACVNVMAHMWKSENNLCSCFFFFPSTMWIPEAKLRLSSLMISSFIPWAISPVLKGCI